MEVIYRTMISARKPWQSADAGEPVKAITEQEQKKIDKCLCCPFAECVDCLSKKIAAAKRESAHDAREVIVILLGQGLSVSEVARRTGCARSTVRYYRERKNESWKKSS